MRALAAPHVITRYLLSAATVSGRWANTLAAAGAIAIVYYLAARLGLALLSKPSDVAVFWPASGIAAGILIISGRRACAALATGVVIGTIAANLMADRSLLTSLLKGFCNAGEAALVASLLERWFGRPFRFGDLRQVVGFVAAAVLATAASATGGAATMTLLHSAAPYSDVWRTWFLSDWVGIVVVTPLVIGVGELWHKPASAREWVEGLGVLTLTTLASYYTVSHKSEYWLSFSPGAIVLPLLLWLTARCPPAFGSAGAFIASAAVMVATTFGVGRFGDAAVPIMERVKGAQAAMITVTLYTLVLVALFAQRKKTEEVLRERENQLAKKSAALARLHQVGTRLWYTRDLRQALDDILTGAIELLGADMGTIRILDAQRDVLKVEAHRGFNQKALDFVDGVPAAGDSLCARALRAGERMVIEDIETDDLFAPFRALARAAGYRAMQSTPIMSREGIPLGMLATHFRSVRTPDKQDLHLLDLYVRQAAEIIERYKAENLLRESEARLNAVIEGAADGILTINEAGIIQSLNTAAAKMFGYAAEEVIYRNVSMLAPEPYRSAHDRYLKRYRETGDAQIIGARREVLGRRKDGQTFPMDLAVAEVPSSGQHLFVGIVNDISGRKRAEERQRTLVAELDHRVKNALATVSSVVSHTRYGSRSVPDFAAALQGRLRSMAATHELLSAHRWEGVSLADIVQRELAPYTARNNTELSGPEVMLRAEAGQAMAMVVHELATNAAKYGALSVKKGRVSIRWGRRRNEHAPCLVVEWQEISGPPVIAPGNPSYGTSTIRDLIPYEFGGTVDLVFAPEGVRCLLELPADWLGDAAHPTMPVVEGEGDLRWSLSPAGILGRR